MATDEAPDPSPPPPAGERDRGDRDGLSESLRQKLETLVPDLVRRTVNAQVPTAQEIATLRSALGREPTAAERLMLGPLVSAAQPVPDGAESSAPKPSGAASSGARASVTTTPGGN